MNINLLQTMEWSKLCWDQSFEKLIPLDLILPRIGEIYPVKFEENESFVKEGYASILWQPPHSELNGWDDKRPSEILKSYVIQGLLNNTNAHGLAFNFEVSNRMRLVEYFEHIEQEDNSPLPYIGQPDGSSKILWQDVSHIFKANIGSYIYLSGSECETTLEIILSFDDNRICIHYSATLHRPAFYETKITRYYLNNREHELFEKLIANAQMIEDNSNMLLHENQIFGAEYW